MDREYQRLLGRDRNPLSFIYGGMLPGHTVNALLRGLLNEIQVSEGAGRRMSQPIFSLN